MILYLETFELFDHFYNFLLVFAAVINCNHLVLRIYLKLMWPENGILEDPFLIFTSWELIRSAISRTALQLKGPCNGSSFRVVLEINDDDLGVA